jgi:glycosyltransferase involved in cell wall biosynthesis
MSGTFRRILFIEGNLDGTIGGSFYSLLFLAKNLDRSRFHATVIFPVPNELIPTYEAAGIRVFVRPNTPPFHLRRRWLDRLVARPVNLLIAFVVEPLRLAKICRDRHVDLVHLNNTVTGNLPWMIGAWLARVPCVTHERGINPSIPPRARFCSRFLDAVICISDAVRGTVESLKLRPRLVTIANGLDAREMSVATDPAAIRAEFGLSPDRPLIGMVGNLRAWKGQETVVRAVALLRRKHPDIACLLIGECASGHSTFRARLEQLIDDEGVRGNVIVTGYRANVADYVNALEVVVHASVRPEPFGRVLLEAMALSKPLVASRGGAAPEIVADGRTGLLATPGDAADFAGKIGRLLDDSVSRERFGKAGFARLREEFGIERNVRLTQDLYEEILGQRCRSVEIDPEMTVSGR